MSLYICLFWILHTESYTMLKWWKPDMFSRFIHVVAYIQYFISFSGWIIFSCICIPHLFLHLPVDGHMGCFYLLVIMNHAVMNIHLQVFVWIPVFSSFGYIFRVKMLGHIAILLNIEEWSNWFPQQLHHFTFPPATSGFQFLHIPANTCHFLGSHLLACLL